MSIIKKCLFEEKEQCRKMVVIRSYNHQLYIEEVNKIALGGDDDKRHVLENKLDTLTFGHYKLMT